MSFPRAKIQRFNDAQSCAPPPGRYDPKFEDKVKGAAIQKCERFMELKSTSQSSNSTESPGNLSLTSNSSKSASFNCLPVFRTPQLPRKHAKQGSSTQVKSKLKFEQLQKNGSAKEVDTEMYEALLVERDNKDATIKENEVHIEELCERIRKLEKELQDIKSEREKCKKEKEEKIEEMLLKLEVQTKDLTDLKLELEKNNSDLLKTKETCCELEKLLDEKELSLLSHKQDKEDLLLQINELKEKEIEHRSRYEMDVRELNTHYKMLEEVAAELKAVQTTKKDLQEEVMKLKESVGILSDTNSDLNCKLNQKQQLILWLQGELSSVGLELEECKSENEKMVNDFRQVKEDLIEKHNSEMEEKLNAIEDLKKLIVNEREMRLQEVQTLQENIMNSSVVRENLESSISDKEVALLTLKDKYAALEIAYEESHSQWKNADETLKSQLNELTLVYEEKINDLKTKANKKEEEIEMKLKALGDKYCALEAEYDKACLEHKLVTEAQRLEMDDLHKKYEDDLNKARMLAHEKNQELEDMREVIDSSTKQFQNHLQNIEENLKEVKETLHNRISDYEDESSKILKDTESKVEMKIKESEMKFQQLVGEVHYTEEQLRQVTHHRDKLRISNMEHQLTIVELQDKIDTLVTELNSNRENYEADLAFVKNEHNISKRQCKKLNIGITNIQASLEALRKRLLESERDAEQMTQAFHQVKAQKAEADEQIKILTQELEAARESMAHLERETVNQIEEVQKGLLNKLEEFRMKAERNVTAKEEEILEHRHKIEELSTRIFELNETLSAVEETNSEHEREIEALTEKLDHQRDCAKFATQQIAKLEASNSFYQHQIQALTNELDYQKDFSQKASDHIAAIATVKSNQEREINNLTVELNTEKGKVLKLSSEIQEIRREFDSYKEEMRTIFQNYHCDCETGIKQGDVGDGTVEKVCEHRKKIEIMNSDVKEFKRVLDSVVESRILQTKQDFQRSLAESETEASHADHWEKKCRELEALIGPFREQLEVFKEECKALELKKEAAEEQIKELSLRYTEILGHQNHKQKIKHLIKLKDHNFELSKEVERLEEQVRSQKRIIDKFKAEQRMASARKQVLQHHNPPSNSKGKENIENGPHQKSPLKAPSAKPLKSYR